MPEEKTIQITDKKEIEKIIEEKIKNRKLVFTNYYWYTIDKKGLSHKLVLETFPRFELVFAIEQETLKHGDLGYELFYKLSGNTSLSIATCPKNKELLIIHAVEYKRKLDKRIKTFKT